MSLSSRIIIRLTITTAIATGISYGWLYIKQSHVDAYLRQLTLVRQAREVSSYIELSPDGSVEVGLPARLSEAYNSPGSRYRPSPTVTRRKRHGRYRPSGRRGATVGS